MDGKEVTQGGVSIKKFGKILFFLTPLVRPLGIAIKRVGEQEVEGATSPLVVAVTGGR